MTYFAVITDIGDDIDGNYACGELLINPDSEKCIVGSNLVVDPPFYFIEKYFRDAVIRDRDAPIDVTKKQMIFCSIPVFSLGEILIMDEANDRTIPDGRKPNKWDVKYETFNDIDLAIKRAKEIMEK